VGDQWDGYKGGLMEQSPVLYEPLKADPYEIHEYAQVDKKTKTKSKTNTKTKTK